MRLSANVSVKVRARLGLRVRPSLALLLRVRAKVKVRVRLGLGSGTISLPRRERWDSFVFWLVLWASDYWLGEDENECENEGKREG